jgi:N utilization substance protein A
MNPEIMEALQALAADRGISVDALFAALADALESAYKRMPGAHEFSWVTIDPETMDIRVLAQDLKRLLEWLNSERSMLELMKRIV